MDTSHLFPPFPVPEDLALEAKERQWPDGLLQRLLDLRADRADIKQWLADESTNVDELDGWATRRERLAFGTLRARKADVSDHDQFAEVWVNAPQDLGDWEVVVERHPNAYAQWRLQENVVINVLVDRGLMVACQGNSRRNTFVAGERFNVSLPQAVRVRKEFRRLDYSQMVTGGGGGPHPNSPFDNATYMYVRTGNLAAYEWMRSVNPEAFPEPADAGGNIPGVDTWVLMYPAASTGAVTSGIRLATPRDLPKCVSLINRTHRGLDLFRPYSVDFLENRLDEGSWAPKTGWHPHVYGWPEFYVLEEDGAIVACGGLWDRGRDMREIWRRKDGSEENVITATALMDFGYARHRSDAMARLVSHFIDQTHELGRTFLLAPLQFDADLERDLEALAPVRDHRRVQWWPGRDAPQVRLTRPYTDLAYW